MKDDRRQEVLRLYHLALVELYRGGYTAPMEQVVRVLAVTREQVAEAARR